MQIFRRIANLIVNAFLNIWNKYFANSAKYWDAMYARAYSLKLESLRERARHYVIAGLVNDHLRQRGRILDIGCGSGTTVDFLNHNDREYHGIDLSQRAIASAKSRYHTAEHVTFEVADFLQFSTPNRYDVIFLNEVLYYFPPQKVATVLEKASSLLTPQGIIIISMSANLKAKLAWRKCKQLANPLQDISLGSGGFGKWRVKVFRPQTVLAAEPLRAQEYEPALTPQEALGAASSS